MEKHDKNIDDLFRERLGDYSEAPPPAAWDALEKRMAARPPARPSAGFPRSGYIALTVLVAAVAVVSIVRKTNDNANAPIARNTLVEQATGTSAADHATEARATAPAAPATANNNGNTTTAPSAPGNGATAPQSATAGTTATATTAPSPAATVAPVTRTATANNNATQNPSSTTHANNTNNTTRTHATPASSHTESVPGPSYVLSGTPASHAGGANHTTATQETTNTVRKHGGQSPATTLRDGHTGPATTLAANTPRAIVLQSQTAIPAEHLSNPSALEDGSDNTETGTRSSGTGATVKHVDPQGHKKMVTTTPAAIQPAAKTTARRDNEEVESLTTNNKRIGITNSLNALSQKAIPATTTPVYNATINAAPEQRTGNGGGDGARLADVPAKATQPNISMPPAVKTTPTPKPEFARFEAGFKLGFEKGFNGNAATKFAAAPYVQFNMSPKLAIMLQPAVKTAKVNNVAIGGPDSYYKINNDGNTKMVDSTPAYIPVAGSSTPETFWVRKYSYSQTHDSVVKTNTYGGTYIELELPILLKYSITPKLSVYGGPNIAYSKLMGVTEHTYTSGPITQTGTANTVAAVNAPAPEAPALNTVITYNGTPYSSYSGQAYAGATGPSFRLGYMAGVSYQFHDRWLADGLIQQGMAKQDVKAGYNINSTISAAYFRLSVGYRLIK